MDLVHHTTSDGAAEDRIFDLPDDIIYRILSFLDMKYAVQTSLLSRRWKHAWKSMPNVILSNHNYNSRKMFANFVHEALSRRDNQTEVSALDLNISGDTEQSFVKPIVKYAYLHNVTKLTMIWCSDYYSELPRVLFSSPTLKHLTLGNRSQRRVKFWKHQTLLSKSSWYFPDSWELPALETLNLSNLCFDFLGNKNVNMFSKCKNLKDLVLHRLEYRPLETFNVCAPQLINLTITDFNSFPKVFNVVAPQLKNMTASVTSYFSLGRPTVLPLFTEGFNYLEKVSLSFGSGDKEKTHGSQILDLFPIFCNAKLLILDVNIIERLSMCMDRIIHERGPFINLKCLKINTMPHEQYEPIATILVQVNNYLLHNSLSATTSIGDFPQVPQKRSRQQLLTELLIRLLEICNHRLCF
ncbi:F-box/LRR-repeat protein At3g26922-like [Rutidosis leptorrhynchoides]|uniref:F-box/LRR-repeat protein At3g26922-like n=1 Tax=Rutidosis leptorrhynchoides TaxID=125765 RepID=UPI003A993A6B